MRCNIILLCAFLIFSGRVSAEGINISIVNGELETYAEAVAKTLDKTLILDKPLSGKVTLDENGLDQKQYYEIFLTIMRANNYSVVDMGKIIKIIPNAKKKALGNIESVDVTRDLGRNSQVTRTLSLYNIKPQPLLALLNQMIPENSATHVSAIDSADIIVFTGYLDEVESLRQFAENLDIKKQRENILVQLRHASAENIIRLVEDSMQQQGGSSKRFTLRPELQSNSIFISAESELVDTLQELIQQLDSDTEVADKNAVFYLKYLKAGEVEEIMKKVLKAQPQTLPVSVVAAENINALIITAPPEQQKFIHKVIEQLDIRRAQVNVEALIVEIADGAGLNFGVQWGSTRNGIVQFNNAGQLPISSWSAAMKGSGLPSSGENKSEDIQNPLGSILSKYNGAALGIVSGNWNVLVQALKTSSQANILSTPSLTTLDNQQASFMVGENVPILTGSTSSSDNKTPFQTVERRSVGTKLTVVPQINQGNAIQLKINAEVSKLQGSTGLDVIFAERKLDTTVLVNDGETIVLGGLIDDQRDTSEYSVPYLSKIPLVGWMFKSKNKDHKKRNLMIFIRPTIIRDNTAAGQVTQRRYRDIYRPEVNAADFFTPPVLNALPLELRVLQLMEPK
ncbi:secretin N-terminal domain-containing protein [Serratia quinivorans]|uniref:secretin N-terminal domain-containing protein n=1 Tax=Serratia quinivorans TaxID=137545 RepID=UPI00217BBE49|nr:secretin N-terminal domain-containing protein [Serratia quinivorans]CAI1113954.1 Pullulanase secretion envelope pulD [Serratia quinivorans]CAI1875620.1 Pullulanase secretion envelope pulD [Serratia quinivorans]